LKEAEEILVFLHIIWIELVLTWIRKTFRSFQISMAHLIKLNKFIKDQIHREINQWKTPLQWDFLVIRFIHKKKTKIRLSYLKLIKIQTMSISLHLYTKECILTLIITELSRLKKTFNRRVSKFFLTKRRIELTKARF
jgi:hypothetical protein